MHPMPKVLSALRNAPGEYTYIMWLHNSLMLSATLYLPTYSGKGIAYHVLCCDLENPRNCPRLVRFIRPSPPLQVAVCWRYQMQIQL
jgi:hypothetical protein